MAVLIRSKQQLLRQGLNALEDSGLLTDLSPGQAGFVLSQLAADQMSELYQSLQANTSQAVLATATGAFLDLIAELFGVFRLPEQAAASFSDERNVRFYVNSGTLAAKIPTKVIPAGTTVNATGGFPAYVVLEDVPFSDVATEAFVGVVSSGVGPNQNVGKNELVNTDLAAVDVLVTNDQAISTAVDVETDEQLRSRLADAMFTRVSGNRASLAEAVNIVPGVSEIRMVSHKNGPGTVEITIIPVSNNINERVLTIARANLDEVRAAGTFVDIRGPRFVPVEITILLRYQTTVGEGEKPGLRQQAQQAILEYLSSLRLGQTFIVKEMIQRVLDVSDGILDFETRCFAFRRRAQVLRNFTPDPDELLVPDSELAEPIRVL
jgi:uncharacterized phage protein gp47/JayE